MLTHVPRCAQCATGLASPRQLVADSAHLQATTRRRRCNIGGTTPRRKVIFAVTVVQITFKVTSCSVYVDDREPSYHELCEKAWILRPASKQRAAGFVRAADLSGEEARRLLVDPTEKS